MGRVLSILLRFIVKKSWLSGFCLLGACRLAAAQLPAFVPADFPAENRLWNFDVSPDELSRGATSMLVLCQAFVETDGEVSNAYCGNNVDKRLLNAEAVLIKRILDAVSGQTLVPAKVDGEAVRVLMNFAVAIDCSLGSCVTVPIRNHGYYFEEYGPEYVSPQPILADDVWYEGFDYKLEWMEGWLRTLYGAYGSPMPGGSGLPYMISIEIDLSGQPSGEPSLIADERDYLRREPAFGALDRATQSIGTVGFIPGFVGNEPVTMRLHERTIAPVMCSGGC